ncbi:MAG: putative selenium-dependent hydroxylase accessory protein YqeC [Gammaproteobacteria bacterium]|jgi:probable selenium-dependent hydroxylase accessory protein YqeC|nr:putative selenium-dependent hydroxylase accessory protein YqeC [Gammaproteobacteria bacterium]
MNALIDVLEAREGLVCAVGAGGKKSVLYQLVREHPGPVALTSTAHTTEFPAEFALQQIITDDAKLQEQLRAAGRSRQTAYACPSDKPGRHAGVSPATIRAIHDSGAFAATYVKADGARMRWIKAPSPDEPILVPGADLVIPVVSARAIGEPLSERVAHRIERVAAVTGVAPGEPLTPEAVGKLLASEQGSLQFTAGARVAPVINMVDNEEREEKARAAATAAIAMTSRFDRVVLCCLRRPERPVVAVVTG